MAAFTDDEIDADWSSWSLFQNGGVVLFRDLTRLESATTQLLASGYQLHPIDCTASVGLDSVLFAIVDSLKIPRFPKINLDGFNDFISDVDFGSHKGVVVALLGFERLLSSSGAVATNVLDILASHHRSHLLMGNRFLTIVQTDDPRMDEKLGLVGGYQPAWNPGECMNRDRGL
ncbi:hypothetical protein RBSH_05329 [Rhodopirellula baltica SH28]|uniref:Barstar (barnase inhibitor) domain-containing protein n=1 Tax=Rhodopirellula baltica SH28 TaxID=993517 RepID=K5E0T7_RHOBT|nr:hypothetical protein RBSH_05329 [Rhodopirellula baltica SH28]